jgi:hypothetical protein
VVLELLMNRKHWATAGQLAYVVLLLAMTTVGTLSMATAAHDVHLEGVEMSATRPAFRLASVRHETFQKEMTAWFEQRWGLRGYAVRTENTIGVHIFGETRTDQHPVVGDDGVLFTRDDLAYVNRAEPSDATIALAQQFARVQKKLRARGRLLLPVVIPSKTTFHRKSVPSSWRRRGAFGHSDDDLYRPFVRTLADTRTLFVDARAILTAEAKKPEATRAP